LTEEAHQIIKSIRQMEAALSDDKRKRNNSLDDGTLKVYTPLNRCLSDLREKYDAIASVHKERFEQVKSRYPCRLHSS
jgi:protein regulator of cytokinesis 1